MTAAVVGVDVIWSAILFLTVMTVVLQLFSLWWCFCFCLLLLRLVLFRCLLSLSLLPSSPSSLGITVVWSPVGRGGD